ncbi:single-stranded-DNA-specific exonuclease RecJ [Umboniibacter marinipuniceus]|uniref:Single-stranded-DNA-specific exonuclease RecJ n=1 Tax=Umboniibacter marinipuniceus TaxID=569599 RepID=A0A3M0A953_9GAMM|nr:single-stranded-DNA-specific exonuclease RecJ [Umboniibacter marinipuniceus]RMA79348.1 exonuclease RecJ [Umboniibacter marinipuniceus]
MDSAAGEHLVNIQRRKALTKPLDNYPELLARVLAHRGIQSEAELPQSLAQLLPPTLMMGLSEAAEIVAAAIAEQKRILIVGDFDCDGATSVALAMLGLSALGANHVDYLVPNRFEFGYGLSTEIVEVARERSPDLIITVDNGISSVEGVALARSYGWDVVVTDHHLPGDQLPDASEIVNPNQHGCEFPSKHLAGVGVMFYLLIALRSRLRALGNTAVEQVNLAQWLDIVAVGTVADVVPLDANNRLLVSQGLARIRSGRCRPGIKALLQIAKRDPVVAKATDLGFAVGPRLNAAGRLDDISVGIRCLLTSDDSQAMTLADQLNQYNVSRREIEASMQAEAAVAVKAITLTGELPWGLCVYEPSWHAGVVGIVASRLKEQHHRPVIVFADESDGFIKGSGRSIPGLHLRDALDQVAKQAPEVLHKFGGHAMAAGLSIHRAHFEAFCERFDEVVRSQLTADDLTETLLSDGVLTSADLHTDNAKLLSTAQPWGQGFPEPSFDGEFFVVSSKVLQDKHVKLTLAPVDNRQHLVDGILFNYQTADRRWHEQTSKIHAVYQLDVNRWRGNESLQLMLRHLDVVYD